MPLSVCAFITNFHFLQCLPSFERLLWSIGGMDHEILDPLAPDILMRVERLWEDRSHLTLPHRVRPGSRRYLQDAPDDKYDLGLEILLVLFVAPTRRYGDLADGCTVDTATSVDQHLRQSRESDEGIYVRVTDDDYIALRCILGVHVLPRRSSARGVGEFSRGRHSRVRPPMNAKRLPR